MEKIEILSVEDLSLIKGGSWYYDETTDTWIWIGTKSLDPYSFTDR